MPEIYTNITDRPIEFPPLLEFLQCDPCGAQSIFAGTVRDLNESKKVSGLKYDAHQELAEKILSDICRSIELKGDCRIYAVHRIGELEIGETSVLIGVSTPHRKEAFSVCREIIERIKQELPIWKKEHYLEQESSWLAGHRLSADAPNPR